MMTNEEKKLLEIINKATANVFQTSVPFETEQLKLLDELNTFSVQQVLDDIEVIRDPRKLIYKGNQELRTALVALCLTQSLTNPHSRSYETKEFYENNIAISSENNGTKILDFGHIPSAHVKDALNAEKIYDWMIYRDKEGRGIKALADKKMYLDELPGYYRGGDPIYEFARFERKFTEHRTAKELKSKETAQDAFRTALVQQVAAELAKQQMLNGQNPIELVNLLFSSEDYNQAVSQMVTQTTPQRLQITSEKSPGKKKF